MLAELPPVCLILQREKSSLLAARAPEPWYPVTPDVLGEELAISGRLY
jgi:hypothetical protein